MIEIKEIRVGNCVYMDKIQSFPPTFISVEPIIISEVRKQDFEPVCLFAPIPLTEEWLIKFGFELIGGWYIQMVDSYKAKIRIKQQGNEFNFCFKRNNAQVSLRTVKYVHDLQNLFYDISKEELKLK